MGTRTRCTFTAWLQEMASKKECLIAKRDEERRRKSTQRTDGCQKKRYRGLWRQKFGAVNGSGHVFDEGEKRQYVQKRFGHASEINGAGPKGEKLTKAYALCTAKGASNASR